MSEYQFNEEGLPILPTGEEMEQEHPSLLKELDWQSIDISEDWLDPADEYTRPKYTLSFNDTPFAPLGGIHALTGQPGHGKTMTFTQLMVAVLRGEYGGLKYELTDEIPSPKVLYIDTEMEKGNTQLVMLRVYQLMGWTYGEQHDEFRVIMLRETENAEDRWRKTLKAIWEVRPTVAFIDGLLDVVGDFNDNERCQKIIYGCMKVASFYGISLWCLVHENPGSTKMVGHMGSMLERKVTDQIKTVKKKEGGFVSFTVSQGKARGKDMNDWTFTVEDGPNRFGVPVQSSEQQAPVENAQFSMINVKMEDIARIQTIITSHDGVSTRMIREQVQKMFGVGVPNANKLIDLAVDNGFIQRGDNKRYYLHDNSEQTVAPF